MPYIKPEERYLLEFELEELSQTILADGFKHYDIPELSGRLNYVITELVNRTLLKDAESYDKFNSAIGMLESAKLELYARKVRAYEDIKIAANGDIKAYEKLLNDCAK